MKKSIFASFVLTTLLTIPVFAESPAIWIIVQGKITEYGGVPVARGWCGALAKVEEWAKVYAFWTPMIPEFSTEPPDVNSTFSFYAANLTHASAVELNYMGRDFYISGQWDVYKITFAHYGDCNVTWTIELIADHAAGDLSVTGNWTNFTIDITGIELLSGPVTSYRIKSEPIPIGDCSGLTPGVPDCKCDIWDLVHFWITGFITAQPLSPGHDIAVINIKAWPTAVPQGQPVFIEVTVENQGNYTENFNATVYADRIGASPVHIPVENRTVSLDIGERKILEFVWDTSGVPPGSYWITAEAILDGDAEPEDNKARTFIGGIFPPREPAPINIFALLAPVIQAILTFVAIGIIAVGFFKLLASGRPPHLWHSSKSNVAHRI